MPQSFLDHITVTAFSLEAGAAFVSEVLGVSPQAGGEHPRMATHNLLLRLGETMFLEVIAPNPAVPVPARPRWFALDHLGPRSDPCLSTWVVRTSDVRSTVLAASEQIGAIEPMSRGALDWLITIPADGSVPLDGAAPALIEWPVGVHPAAGLEDRGLSLARLEIRHPDPCRVSQSVAVIAGAGGPCFGSVGAIWHCATLGRLHRHAVGASGSVGTSIILIRVDGPGLLASSE